MIVKDGKWQRSTKLKTILHLFFLPNLHIKHVRAVELFIHSLPPAQSTWAAIFSNQNVFQSLIQQTLLAPRSSLICLPSPLIIMFIKVSLIPPPLSLHQILFMLFTAHICMHAGSVMYFQCSIYLQPLYTEAWIYSRPGWAMMLW